MRATMRVSAAGMLLLVACGDSGGGDDDGGGGDIDAAVVDASGSGPDAGDGAADCERTLFDALEQGSSRAIAADETHVYLVTSVTDEASVWRIDRRDGGGELLTTLPLDTFPNGFLLLDDDSLYVSGPEAGEGTLYRVAKDGAGEPELITADLVASAALDATHIYWSAASFDPEPEPAIKRQPIAGGDEEVLVLGADEIGRGAQIAILGDHLYWNDETNLWRKPVAGGASEVFDHLGPRGPDSTCEFCLDAMVAADDGRLYWFDTAERTLFYRTGASAFERERISADGTGVASVDSPILIFGEQIYWNASGEIGRAPAAGGETSIVPTGGYVGAFLPTPEGFLVAGSLGETRLIPLDGCPE